LVPAAGSVPRIVHPPADWHLALLQITFTWSAQPRRGRVVGNLSGFALGIASALIARPAIAGHAAAVE
jgi:hypothetical protein